MSALSTSPSVVHLLGGPYVSHSGRRREIPEGSKRLLVYLALHRGRVTRRSAAGALWPVGDDLRASGNLRSSLWRLRGAGIDLIDADKWTLTLADGITVDVHALGDWTVRLIDGDATPTDLAIPPTWPDALDLLPGWYDDWVLIERERMRQRMLHALERLSRMFVQYHRYAEAIEAAMTAVAAEPLRESAQRALIDAHLAEGNGVEGRRALDAYRKLLESELGTAPPADLPLRIYRELLCQADRAYQLPVG